MNHYTVLPTASLENTHGRVLALGSFDGLHIGHRAVVDAAVALAKELNAEPAVFCFDVPPAFYAAGSDLKILGDKGERPELFSDRGVSSLFVAEFSELRGFDARDFITEILIKKCGAVGVVCGFNFAFGKNRAGTPSLLRDYFKERIITLDPIRQLEQNKSRSQGGRHKVGHGYARKKLFDQLRGFRGQTRRQKARLPYAESAPRTRTRYPCLRRLRNQNYA